MFKDILAVCDPHEELPASAVLALDLAEAQGARVTVNHLIFEHLAPIAASAVGAPVEVAPDIHTTKEEMQELRERAEACSRKLRRRADQRGISVDWRRDEGVVDQLAEKAAMLARVHDLCIVDGPNGDEGVDWMAVLEELIRSSGRPCLVLPRAAASSQLNGTVQICWDGSASASRAAHDALPLLKSADKVLIVRLGEDDGQAQASVKKLRAHLERHGVDADVHELAAEVASVAERLADHAMKEGCDMLVMGAYNASWLRRLVFGSVTDETIKNPMQAVFVSH